MQHWERIWAAVGWGQPVAIAAGGIAALYASLVLGTYLATVIAALLLGAVMPCAAATVAVLRLSGAAALTGLVGVHAALWVGRIGDAMAWIVDGALVAIAACLAMPLARRTRQAGAIASA